MANRYTKVYSNEKNLYIETSPLIILAGALLKDEQTGNIIAQLKFKSISEQTIKAVKIAIIPLDTSGEVCGEAIDFNYLDIIINRDKEFGSKEPILMTNPNTRAFKIYVKEVVFLDNTKWENNNSEWNSLDISQNMMDEVLTDSELAKQFRISFGEKCRFKPKNINDLWICSCQAINSNNEESCHECNNKLFNLENYDIDQLKNDMLMRLEEESREAEEKIAKQEEIARKGKKGIKIGLIIGIPIIVAFLIISAITSMNAKKDSIVGDWEAYYVYQGSYSGYISDTVDEFSISAKKEKATTGDTYYLAEITVDIEGSPKNTGESPWEYIKEENGAQYYSIYGSQDTSNMIIVVTDIDTFMMDKEYSDFDYINEGNLLFINNYGTSDAAVQIFRKN